MARHLPAQGFTTNPGDHPVFSLDSDAANLATITVAANGVVSAWSVANLAGGAPLLVPDIQAGGMCVRFAAGANLAIPAIKSQFLSQGPSTFIIVWRMLQEVPNAYFPIIDSSSNNTTPGYQIFARDAGGSDVSAIRRIQVRVSNGASWVMNQFPDSDHTNNYYAPQKWHIMIIQTTTSRIALYSDSAKAIEAAQNGFYPQQTPGPLVLGNCAIDIKSIKAYAA